MLAVSWRHRVFIFISSPITPGQFGESLLLYDNAMNEYLIRAENVARAFGRKTLFEKVTFNVTNGQSFAITGKNGAGKSTLIKILCGLLPPSKGTVKYVINGSSVPAEGLYPFIGLVSPYLNMYDEFSGEENLILFSKIRGLSVDHSYIAGLLKRFNIYDHRKKESRYYSSGMKQRLKYCAALLHRPVVLILDEPTANLDDLGIAVVREVMEEQKKVGSLIFATNETEDLKFANTIFDLNLL
jgi:heme exporter protein A